jgi:hypothetical protein
VDPPASRCRHNSAASWRRSGRVMSCGEIGLQCSTSLPNCTTGNTCRAGEHQQAAKVAVFFFAVTAPLLTLPSQSSSAGVRPREKERPRAHHFTCLLVKCQRLSAVKRFSRCLSLCVAEGAPLFVIFLRGGGGMGAACDDDSARRV